jgi:hypothetical protein
MCRKLVNIVVEKRFMLFNDLLVPEFMIIATLEATKTIRLQRKPSVISKPARDMELHPVDPLRDLVQGSGFKLIWKEISARIQGTAARKRIKIVDSFIFVYLREKIG